MADGSGHAPGAARVIYLTGATNDAVEPLLIAAGVGLMCQPGNGYHRRIGRYPVWAADNGAFAGNWIEDVHMDWLGALPDRPRCLFAVAPDVYPDASASLERGLSFAPAIRSMGFPVAVVAQDGAEQLDWTHAWDEMDCLFIGGKQRTPGWSEWKESEAAAGLVRQARRRGKWVHMGRVNSPRRLWRAWQMGCQSADGTLIKHLRRQRRCETPQERDRRFRRDLTVFIQALGHAPLPLEQWETPSAPLHRELSL